MKLKHAILETMGRNALKTALVRLDLANGVDKRVPSRPRVVRGCKCAGRSRCIPGVVFLPPSTQQVGAEGDAIAISTYVAIGFQRSQSGPEGALALGKQGLELLHGTSSVGEARCARRDRTASATRRSCSPKAISNRVS